MAIFISETISPDKNDEPKEKMRKMVPFAISLSLESDPMKNPLETPTKEPVMQVIIKYPI